MLAHFARIVNALIDSEILFVYKNHPSFLGLKISAMNRVFHVFVWLVILFFLDSV